MEQVKFGLDQIKNPTPLMAKNIFRIVLYTAAVANIVLDIVTEIPPDIKAMIAKYSLYLVTGVHSFSKLFGIDISDIEPK